MAIRTEHPPLSALVSIPITEDLPTSTAQSILSQTPFIPLPSIYNLRDLGLSTASSSTPPKIRPGLLYRSGLLLPDLPPSSATHLSTTLHLAKIIDLRSDTERARWPDPVIEGVANIHLATSRAGAPASVASTVEKYTAGNSDDAFAESYREIVRTNGPSLTAVLEHLRDEGTPILFHCTVGKDRTGVLAALILSLTGCSREAIADDYVLTRVGMEPLKEKLFGMLRGLNPAWSKDTPGVAEMLGVRRAYILNLLDWMDETYGGVKKYVIGVLGFSADDLAKTCAVLRG